MAGSVYDTEGIEKAAAEMATAFASCWINFTLSQKKLFDHK